MKKKIIVALIALVVVVGLLAYYHFVPFWAAVVSTGAFIAGIALGWWLKGRKAVEKEGL